MAQRQMQRQLRFAETKPAAGNFHNMMLAVTGQWVTEVRSFFACSARPASVSHSPQVRAAIGR
jgi:hypothetical protein